MPKLPDDSVLGSLPSPESKRPFVTLDTSAPGVAMEQMGRGIARLGAGIASGLEAIDERRKQQDTVEETVKAGEREVESLKWQQRVREAQNDDEVNKLIEERRGLDQRYIPTIKDPDRRKVQTAKWLMDTERDVNTAMQRANTLRDERLVQTANNTAEEMRRMALEQNTPEARTKAIDTVNAQIDGLVAGRAMTPEKAVEAKRKWAENFAWDDVKMRPPGEAIYAVGGMQAALKAKESTNDPTIMNKYGFAGYYQFGAPRLQTMGVYTPGANEDLSSEGWNKTGKAYPGKWTGTFNIPGFPQVKTVQDFLATPAAQEKAYEIHNQLMDQDVTKRGLDKYIGQTVGGVLITRDGIKMMMHLGGAKGAQDFLDSGGAINAQDANGTKLSQYAAMAAKGGYALAGAISPERRQQLITEKTAQWKQEQVTAANTATAERKVALNELELGLHDGRYNKIDIDRARQSGVAIDFDEVKKLEGILETRLKKEGDAEAFRQIMGGQRTANPFASEDKDALDEGVNVLSKGSGGKITKPMASLMIYEKTGIMPKAGAIAMRGDLISGNVETVADTMNVAANMLARNPNAFAGVDGAKDLEDAAIAFQHYTNDLGLDRADAAKRLITEQTPEWKAKVKVQDGEVKKFSDDMRKNAVSYLRSASFPGSGWIFDNNVGAPQVRDAIAKDYAELATMKYQETGDVSMAKKYAEKQLAKLYGISNGVLMKFPVERNYPAINGSHEWIYRQAADVVKSERGVDVKPKDVVLVPLDNQLTAEAYRAGRPGPYNIMYTRVVDGIAFPEVLIPPGTRMRGFVADPAIEEARRKDEAEQKFYERRKAVEGTPVPKITAQDVDPRAPNPGRPARTMEQRQTIADETNASRQKAANEAAQAADFATRGARDRDANLAKAREDLKNNPPVMDPVSQFISDNTPKNPLKNFPYKPGKGRQ